RLLRARRQRRHTPVNRYGRKHMKTHKQTILASILLITLATAAASAQQASPVPPTTPYGPPIGLEAAKKVMAAAEADAIKNNWGMAIAILDSTGVPVENQIRAYSWC